MADADLDAILAERGARYGEFDRHASMTQQLKLVMKQHRRDNHGSPVWRHLADDQREALEMIAHKIGRILNGDPDYSDSWHDIAGYAKLVGNRLDRKALDGQTESAKAETIGSSVSPASSD